MLSLSHAEKPDHDNNDSHVVTARMVQELASGDERFSLLRKQILKLSDTDMVGYYDQLVYAIDLLTQLFPPGSDFVAQKRLGPLLWNHEISTAEQRAQIVHELELKDPTLSFDELRHRMTVLRVAEEMARLVRGYQQQLERAA